MHRRAGFEPALRHLTLNCRNRVYGEYTARLLQSLGFRLHSENSSEDLKGLQLASVAIKLLSTT